MLKALGPFLEEVGKNMSRVLSETPGGAVVSVIYRDSVIWTRGVGTINMSGKNTVKGGSLGCSLVLFY